MSDGIPSTVGTEKVYVGRAADTEMQASTTAASFLLGGWFHEGRPTIFCPAYLAGTRWGCDAWIILYPAAAGTEGLTVHPTDPPNLTEADVYGATRPVILRVHTHDLACTPDIKDCKSFLVEEALVWAGEPAT